MKIRQHLRGKGADVDKPVGYIKRRVRVWLRRQIARWTRKEVVEEQSK